MDDIAFLFDDTFTLITRHGDYNYYNGSYKWQNVTLKRNTLSPWNYAINDVEIINRNIHVKKTYNDMGEFEYCIMRGDLGDLLAINFELNDLSELENINK